MSFCGVVGTVELFLFRRSNRVCSACRGTCKKHTCVGVVPRSPSIQTAVLRAAPVPISRKYALATHFFSSVFWGTPHTPNRRPMARYDQPALGGGGVAIFRASTGVLLAASRIDPGQPSLRCCHFFVSRPLTPIVLHLLCCLSPRFCVCPLVVSQVPPSTAPWPRSAPTCGPVSPATPAPSFKRFFSRNKNEGRVPR